MTTLENILNPLPKVLLAWQRILEKAGHKVWTVGAFAEPTPNERKLAPYLEIQLMNWNATGREYPFGNDPLEKYWSGWTAELITRVTTNRGKNGDKHVAMIGAVLVLAARYRQLFTVGVLPHHGVAQLRPSGLVSSTDGQLDQSEIHFDMTILVRDDAWPDS